MKNELSIEESKAFATGLFQGAQIVSRYMRERSAAINEAEIRSQIGYKEACVKGLWMRAYAWMQSLEKLGDPLDFQAISAGNRALLEITVDLVLLHSDKTNASAWKMFWWGESEKLRASEQIVNYYSGQGIAVPDEYEGQVSFSKTRKSEIETMRATLWPNRKNPGKHPARWTGNRNLFEDIERADQLEGSAVRADIGSSLVEYYRTEYPKMNWRIHSGVASIRDQPPQSFNLVCGFGFKWSADLAMLCTKFTLTDLGLDVALADLEQEWERIKHKRDSVYAYELYKFHSAPQARRTTSET